MLVFLDFEASSLTKHSYPIEIAWVFEDGRSRTFLIRPAPGWTDWSAKAEAIHGISRELLEHEGAEITVIVQEMMGNADRGRSGRKCAVLGWQVVERLVESRRTTEACVTAAEVRRSLERGGPGVGCCSQPR